MADDFEMQRNRMIEEQIRRRGIEDPATLNSLRTVPRHRFVPPSLQNYSYADGPFAIGEGQTISQPYIVALMTAAAELDPSSKCLDIGTGSGYAAAILSQICSEVYTIERIPQLSQRAAKLFQELGYHNIHLKVGDGTLGWPEHAPYDAIIVTAGAPVIPAQLLSQLKEGGRLIIPVGDATSQQLLRLRKTTKGDFAKEILEHVRFVPLIGKEGWEERTEDF